jgi:hypothetical protein
MVVRKVPWQFKVHKMIMASMMHRRDSHIPHIFEHTYENACVHIYPQVKAHHSTHAYVLAWKIIRAWTCTSECGKDENDGHPKYSKGRLENRGSTEISMGM